jgi:hypothetical protein
VPSERASLALRSISDLDCLRHNLSPCPRQDVLLAGWSTAARPSWTVDMNNGNNRKRQEVGSVASEYRPSAPNEAETSAASAPTGPRITSLGKVPLPRLG